MKPKSAYLEDSLAADLDRISEAHRMSTSQVIALAVEQLVKEVKATGRLPLPVVVFSEQGESAPA